MFSMLFWGGIGALVGVTFSEGIRAWIRKVTKGRFFGPVPASEMTLKDKV